MEKPHGTITPFQIPIGAKERFVYTKTIPPPFYQHD